MPYQIDIASIVNIHFTDDHKKYYNRSRAISQGCFYEKDQKRNFAIFSDARIYHFIGRIAGRIFVFLPRRRVCKRADGQYRIFKRGSRGRKYAGRAEIPDPRCFVRSRGDSGEGVVFRFGKGKISFLETDGASHGNGGFVCGRVYAAKRERVRKCPRVVFLRHAGFNFQQNLRQ